MKKNSFPLILTAVLLISISAFAIETHQANAKKAKTNPIISLKTEESIEIGLQTYWYKYKEEVDGNFFMSTTGQKYGLSLSGTKRLGEHAYLLGDLRCAAGDVKYKNDSGTAGFVPDYMYEARLLLGVEKEFDTLLLSPFIGIGYRYLYNDLRDLGNNGYRRESQYIYIPIGITHRFRLNYKARISTTFEYDYFVQGKQTSYLSDIGPAYASVFGDPVNYQNHGYGLRFSTSHEEEHWSIGLFFHYWRIGDSEVNYYSDPPLLYSIIEPKNETKEIGLQVKYRF